MRVVAGVLGGRSFEAPRGHRTHPMSDKVRGALFNALGDVGGLTVLDAFTGSGALSIEAMSRGAASAVAIDLDKGAITTVVNSLMLLGLSDKVKAIRANAGSWSANNPGTQFDLVLLDPPYDDVQHTVLARLALHAVSGGLVVLSLPPTATFELDSANFEPLSIKSYGDARLIFYRRR